jgi:hypothetical protein
MDMDVTSAERPPWELKRRPPEEKNVDDTTSTTDLFYNLYSKVYDIYALG